MEINKMREFDLFGINCIYFLDVFINISLFLFLRFIKVDLILYKIYL